MSAHIDEEKTKKAIAHVLEKINTEADPWLLSEYHRLFKKEVSLFHRSKVAAYLLMLCDQEKSLRLPGKGFVRAERGSFRKAGRDKKGTDDSPPNADAPRYPFTDEESKRLFFSVGRSRRVFPREILGLINTKTAIPKEDIGAIRILDNYSFVQVRDTVAERIIEELNGCMFRGRTLTVNYAKSRKDEEDGAADEGNADDGETLGEYAENGLPDAFASSDPSDSDLPDSDMPNSDLPDDEDYPVSEHSQHHAEEEDI